MNSKSLLVALLCVAVPFFAKAEGKEPPAPEPFGPPPPPESIDQGIVLLLAIGVIWAWFHFQAQFKAQERSS